MKPWYKSKTVVYNGTILLAAMLGALLTFMGELEAAGYAAPAAVAALVALDKVVNLVLRFMTTTGIGRVDNG